MQFRYKLQYQLVKILGISNKEAGELIGSSRISINEKVIYENCMLSEGDSIFMDGKLIRKGIVFAYFCYHKPRGIETTLSKDIPDSVANKLQLEEGFFHIGRLDKESEGLLLFTNDGVLANQLLNKSKKIEKEYIVEVDKEITPDFLHFLANGVEIMGKKTLPCKVERIGANEFRIVLVEGMNRQIRRMCYKAQYSVTMLRRVKFAGIELSIEEGATRLLAPQEIELLRSFGSKANNFVHLQP